MKVYVWIFPMGTFRIQADLKHVRSSRGDYTATSMTHTQESFVESQEQVIGHFLHDPNS